jgi:hypothetical protein
MPRKKFTMRVLKIFTLIALMVLLSCVPTRTISAQQATPAQGSGDDQSIHQVAMKLLEAMGTRKVLTDNIDAMIENGKQKMAAQHPELDPAFSEEWSRRMHARIQLDDFLAVIAAIYEKHFNISELKEMTALYNDIAANHTPQVSDALKVKLNAVMPEIQADMGAGLLELSEKIGSEVAVTVAKDHPEYVKAPPPADTAADPAPQK